MSSMSRNNSATSLMGFSVHQPAIGAPLQFFPAMGSKQLDDMIDVYIPGDISILDKRAAVSMEFFEHAMATGELFKFFMVYPTLGSANPSPTIDSGYYSGFSTSPALSERQWANTVSQMPSPSSAKKTTSANDFSNLPGMKIMTKDGQDVTNSASRGCKTKEQRDHAHLMRIIKACDSCRRKKTKCDPSHKRPSGTSSGKVTKKTSRNPRPAAAPPQIAARQASVTPEFDQIMSASSSSLDSLCADSEIAPVDSFSLDWDQFIQYDEEPTQMFPHGYDFFLDPIDYLSPATTSFSSSSTSPSQPPITPIDRDVNITNDFAVDHNHKPTLPYLNPGVGEAGSNYVDFNLYSPQSSFLDEELGLVEEIAASPIQPQRLDPRHRRRIDPGRGPEVGATTLESSNHAADIELGDAGRQGVPLGALGDSIWHGPSNYMHQGAESSAVFDATSQDGVLPTQHTYLTSDARGAPIRAVPNTSPVQWLIVDDTLELYKREEIDGPTPSRPLPSQVRLDHNELRLIPGPYTADIALGIEKRRLLSQGGCAGAPEGDGAVATVRSLSPQRDTIRSCGQDEVARAEFSAEGSVAEPSLATRTMNSQTVTRWLSDPLDNLHNIQPSTVAHNSICSAPNAEISSPSPSPSPANVRSPSMQRSSVGLSNRPQAPVVDTEVVLGGSPTTFATRRSLAEQNCGSSGVFDSGSDFQCCISPCGSDPAVTSWVIVSDTWPSISAIASLSMPLVALSLVAHTVIKRGNGPIKGAQPIVSGNLMRYTFLLFIASYRPWLLALFAIWALPLGSRLHQFRGSTSLPSTKAQSSIPLPSYRLPSV